MAGLYPDIRPYARHRLPVGEGHELYVEECGSPEGLPAVFLHGGPGAGVEPFHRRFFDPHAYRVVLYDQRGAGRSTPHASLEANTTWHLVADLERLREHLGIERWVLFGGSWGSTLALAYAQRHPQRVLGMILRGVFLCTRRELDWFYRDGASRLFPDRWEEFLRPIPEAERGDLLQAYHRRLTGENELARMAAAKAWAQWEAALCTLRPDPALVAHLTDPRVALALARIECHYFVHGAFLEPEQLLRDAPRLAGIPGILIHGRYDVVCPLEAAWRLHRAWPEAELRVVEGAGHSAGEPGIAQALVEATGAMAARLRGTG